MISHIYSTVFQDSVFGYFANCLILQSCICYLTLAFVEFFKYNYFVLNLPSETGYFSHQLYYIFSVNILFSRIPRSLLRGWNTSPITVVK